MHSDFPATHARVSAVIPVLSRLSTSTPLPKINFIVDRFPEKEAVHKSVTKLSSDIAEEIKQYSLLFSLAGAISPFFQFLPILPTRVFAAIKCGVAAFRWGISSYFH